MLKIDNMRLIQEASQRPALWDSTMQPAIRKDVCAFQWQEVANKMQVDVSACKKRFKGLRDQYRAEIRKILQKRTQGSNWPYFRAMEFLRSICDPNNLVPFPPAQHIECDYSIEDHSKVDDFSIALDDEDSCDFEIMGDIFKRDPTTITADTQSLDASAEMAYMHKHNMDYSASMNRSDFEVSSPKISSPLMSKGPTAKRRHQDTQSGAADAGGGAVYQNGHMTTTPAVPALHSPTKDDPDYNFLVSLLPHVKSLSSMNNLRFRMDVSRMLMELNQSDIQSSSELTQPHHSTPHQTAKRTGGAAPTSNFSHHETTAATTSSDPTEYIAQSSTVECDVKIENEFLLN